MTTEPKERTVTPEETRQTREFELRHTSHGGGDYSIAMETRNCHASFDTHDYGQIPGNRVRFVIFDMTLQDIKALSHAILIEAIKIEVEEKDQ